MVRKTAEHDFIPGRSGQVRVQMVDLEEFLSLGIARRRLERCFDSSRAMSGLYDPLNQIYYFLPRQKLYSASALAGARGRSIRSISQDEAS